MHLIESIKGFLYLLGVEPYWGVILLIVIIISALVPWRLEYKIEETEDEDGKKTYRIYHFRDKE